MFRQYRNHSEIIGYSYESGLHCLNCTYNRFPILELDSDAVLFDREGNEVRPVFLGDEFSYNPSCDDCHEELD